MTYSEALARIVGEGMASPVDLRTSWTVRDVFDALDSLAWVAWRRRVAEKASK